MSEAQARRYKGTSPFSDIDLDRRIFFGRDRECRSLQSLVLAEDLVVLFAKSGMGKTSLINAGLLQPLRLKGYFPMVVRVNNRREGPLRSMFDGIRQAVKTEGVDCVNGDETSAWHFFKKAEFWSRDNDLLRPVLILDQFEELFTLQLPEPRREFAAQLAALVRGRSALAPLGLKASPNDQDLDGDSAQLQIVLSLREDFLAELEGLASDIPGVLHNRFRIGPLSRAGAHQAIIGPARLAHEAFRVAPFSYREKAIDEIVAFLAKKRVGHETIETDAVEPVQLQLICRHLEEQVRERQASEQTEVKVSEFDLGGERSMQQVLEGFYDRTISTIASRREARSVRKLCEKRLISSTGRRLTEDEEEIEKKFKVSKKQLQALVDTRLLRAEPRLGGISYELSHDTLVTPDQRHVELDPDDN